MIFLEELEKTSTIPKWFNHFQKHPLGSGFCSQRGVQINLQPLDYLRHTVSMKIEVLLGRKTLENASENGLFCAFSASTESFKH